MLGELFLLSVAVGGGFVIGLLFPWRWRLLVSGLVALAYGAIILPVLAWSSSCSDCIVAEADTRQDMLLLAVVFLGFPAAVGVATVWATAGIRYGVGRLLDINPSHI
jgi:hypothetical protein